MFFLIFSDHSKTNIRPMPKPVIIPPTRSTFIPNTKFEPLTLTSQYVETKQMLAIKGISIELKWFFIFLSYFFVTYMLKTFGTLF